LKSQVLYLSWNSIESPLVQSQVLAYLRGLAAKGWGFRLVTLETGRSQGWLAARAQELVQSLESTPAAGKIQWHPVVVPAQLARLGTVTRLWAMRRHVRAILQRHPLALVHARSYLPGWVAAKVCSPAGVPWLFDTRGFWVDEKVDKGGLKAGGPVYSILKRMERKLYRQADAVVMLAEAGVQAAKKHTLLPEYTPVRVIPTCVDINRFRPAPGDPKKRLLCVGSVGPGYLGKEVFRLFALMQRLFPEYDCELCTRSDRRLIERLQRESGVDVRRLRVFSRPHAGMSELLSAGGIGVSLIEPHASKQASCPTKVGEYLACGMPVIYNPGIGDMDTVLDAGQVAVRCSDFSQAGLENTVRQAVALFESPHTQRQCRQLAQDYFSLDRGVDSYDGLYRLLTETQSSGFSGKARFVSADFRERLP